MSVPRQQPVDDMEFYGIDFHESQISLGVTNGNDKFHKFSDFLKEQKSFHHTTLESKRKEIYIRFRCVAAESVCCKIASNFFDIIFSESLSARFQPKNINIQISEKEYFDFSIYELQPFLAQYGLKIHYPSTYVEKSYPSPVKSSAAPMSYGYGSHRDPPKPPEPIKT
jgi:hypothetical protein